MLGTGTPIPDPNRAGPSIAVIYKGHSYLFDVGSGSIHNAIKARNAYDIPALYPSQIRAVFVSHLHSDHVLDFVDLAQTLWWRRNARLQAYGPLGIKDMVHNMNKLMAPDFTIRTTGSQPVPHPELNEVIATTIKPGVIFNQEGMKVEAFLAQHGEVEPSYSFKVTTDDMSIVISGDTSFNETLIEKSTGVDILFHEVISDKGLAKTSAFWQNYHKKSHTPASLLGKLAQRAQPKKLVLYHALFYGASESTLMSEVKENFKGNIVLANDLDRFIAQK